MKKQSKSEQIAQKTIFATFQILKENGGEMRGKEVIEQIRKRVSFDDYENHIYEKTGYVRWESILNFYTIDCIKAGFLRKQSGIWYLTQEGEEAMQLGAEKLLKLANKKYREWNKNKEIEPTLEDDIDLQEQNKAQQQIALLEQYEIQAIEGIREYVIGKNPYEFQDLVAILLKAMGYYIAHIAPKGRDGGIDIIAYTDPLGVNSPRIVVQVKHRPEAKISSDDIQRLAGTMKRSSDVGIFVTSGEFSSASHNEARSSEKHIELIDFDRFLNLWTQYYPKMTDEEKNKLPLYPIYFLGSNE
ncbi:restriction endonuclease [Capnocytophaga cynodegmi]|uniref:restriction endonuclease n=1 Tax=Capnocytophaga cynodegmi TaxID=28189 RepID=UPI00385BD91F